MLSRRAIAIISVILTLGVYAALLAIAPRITLLQADRLSPRIVDRFQVQLREIPPDPPRVRPAFGEAQAGDIAMDELREILGPQEAELTIEDSLEAPPVETPRELERTAIEELERVYELEPEEPRLREVDERILEIAQETARQDIAVARRLVRPSPDLILPPDSLPVLRSQATAPEHIALEPDRPGIGLLAQSVPVPGEMGDMPEGEERPPFEAPALTAVPVSMEPALPRLEQEVIEAPIAREAVRAREESDYVFMDDLVDIRLETYTPSDTEPGYFRLRILPRADARPVPLPKDVTFVIDASSSMQQRKLTLIARGISNALSGFRPEDRFNILLFRDTVTLFQSSMVYATPETIKSAQAFIGNLESRGGTDIYNALLPVAIQEPRPNLPGIILVASDGRPTAGIRDSRIIINSVTADNNLRNSIFAYGAGSTVDRYLLDLLAYRNKGQTRVSANIANALTDISAFIQALNDPLLVNIRADYSRIDRNELYPRVFPDFFREMPIVLYGRFEPGNSMPFVARITGHAGEVAKEMVFRADLKQAARGREDIAQGWAFQKAFHIIGEISQHGELSELVEELRALSRRYSIRTIYDE